MIDKFIICGVSRSGKSILAKRISEKFKISWIVGDAIVTAMEDTFPDLGVCHHGDLSAVGDKLSGYIRHLLWNYHYEGAGYVFEGTHLSPRHVRMILEKNGSIPCIFLGYAEEDLKLKCQQVRHFDPETEDWWTAKLTDEELEKHIGNQISRSREIRDECLALGIPYVEVGTNFCEALEEAEEILLSFLS